MAKEIRAEKYPLDYDMLSKGDYLTPEEVERATDVRRDDHKQYQFSVMRLCKEISQNMEARGDPVTVCSHQDGIKILTDEEASIYNEAEFERGRRKMVRSHVRLRKVDLMALSDENQVRTLRCMEVQSKQLQAMRQSKREALAEARKRAALPAHKE